MLGTDGVVRLASNGYRARILSSDLIEDKLAQHPPAREAGHRRLAGQVLEPCREGRVQHGHLARSGARRLTHSLAFGPLTGALDLGSEFTSENFGDLVQIDILWG